MLKRGFKPKNDISPVRNKMSDLSPLQNPFTNNIMGSPSIIGTNMTNEFGEEVADLEILRPLGSPGDYDIFNHQYESEADEPNKQLQQQIMTQGKQSSSSANKLSIKKLNLKKEKGSKSAGKKQSQSTDPRGKSKSKGPKKH